MDIVRDACRKNVKLCRSIKTSPLALYIGTGICFDFSPFYSIFFQTYFCTALENGGLNSQLMMNPFTLMSGLGGTGGLNPFAGLPGSMGGGATSGGSGAMTPAMLSNLYMQGGFNRRPPGMMEQVGRIYSLGSSGPGLFFQMGGVSV